MMASAKTKSSGALITPEKFQRSVSPSGRFCSSTISSSSSAFASSISSFSSPARSSSPSRISMQKAVYSQSPSVRFSIGHRNASPGRSATSPASRETNQTGKNGNGKSAWSNGKKKVCMCSPTTHPGSFRCGLHKNVSNNNRNNSQNNSTVSYHRLYARRSAMTNSLVRIGTVEGDMMKRALASLIRPSSHQQRRRGDFQPRPSRLSIMSKADD